MASTFSLEVKGLDKLTAQIEKMPQQLQQDLDRSMNAAANEWTNGAVRDAPVFDSKLRGSIRPTKKGFLWYSVSANVFYAAYVEFGTKKKVQVPQGLESIAAEFKGGKGGSFKELLQNIENWVRKKNIKVVGGAKAQSVRNKKGNVKRKAGTYSATAFWIALSIARNGIRPHPYFFKQKAGVEKYLENELVRIGKDLTK